MSDDIRIDLSGSNHSYARLKSPQQLAKRHKKLVAKNEGAFLEQSNDPQVSQKSDPSHSDPFNSFRQNLSVNTNTQGLNDEDASNATNLAKPSTHSDWPSSKLHTKKFSTLTPTTQIPKNQKNATRKKMSTLEEYLAKVRSIIEMILTENSYGLNINKLYQLLSARLGFEFDHRLFNTNTFYEFLINYADNLLDIEVKRNPFGVQNVSYIIYAKNFRFGPPGLMRHQPQAVAENSQSTPVKGDQGLTQRGIDGRKLPTQSSLSLRAVPFNANGEAKGEGQLPSGNKGESDSLSTNSVISYKNPNPANNNQYHQQYIPFYHNAGQFQNTKGERVNISPMVLYWYARKEPKCESI